MLATAKPSVHFPFNYTKILLWSSSPSKTNTHLVWTKGGHTLPALSGQALSWPLLPPQENQLWENTPCFASSCCWGSYLGNQTGHFVAIELIWNTAVDVDRHFALLVALSIRWRDLWLQFFGIFCLEKTGWHKRLQEFSVSDMKKFSPLRL